MKITNQMDTHDAYDNLEMINGDDIYNSKNNDEFLNIF